MSRLEKRIEIITSVASLIEPGKKYLLQIDRTSLSMSDAHLVAKKIAAWGAESIIVLYNGKQLEITEIK